MRTRITRPSLAELWQVLLSLLEGLGAEEAPAQARSLAVAGLTGRTSEVPGVRVERSGDDIVISAADPAGPACLPAGRRDAPARTQAHRRSRALAAR